MKLAGKLFRVYSVGSALIVSAILVVLGLAHYKGMLPMDKIQDIVAQLRGMPEAEASTEERAESAPSTVAEPVTRPGIRLWEERLKTLESRIESDVSGLSAEQDRLQKREQRLREVSDSASALLSVLFSEDISGEEVMTSAAEWVQRLESLRDESQKLPRLFKTLGSMEPKALATILAGNAGEEGIGEEQAVRFLSGLPPRRVGQILSEMGKLDPGRAGRLIGLLGGPESSRVRDK